MNWKLFKHTPLITQDKSSIMCKELISEGVRCLEARGQHFKALLQNKVG